ncbi:hypothetical protein BGW80DRAFT_1332272, partial [Lactifluus volemus]
MSREKDATSRGWPRISVATAGTNMAGSWDCSRAATLLRRAGSQSDVPTFDAVAGCETKVPWEARKN